MHSILSSGVTGEKKQPPHHSVHALLEENTRSTCGRWAITRQEFRTLIALPARLYGNLDAADTILLTIFGSKTACDHDACILWLVFPARFLRAPQAALGVLQQSCAISGNYIYYH